MHDFARDYYTISDVSAASGVVMATPAAETRRRAAGINVMRLMNIAA